MSLRWSAFVVFAFTFLPATGVVAQMHGTPLSGTINAQWSGALDAETLADNSILNEYLAQTFSENVEGASVQISFIPRFNCSPIFSVLLSADSAAAISDDQVVRLAIDDVDMEFPVLVDQSERTHQYSYDASRDEQQTLRARLDRASRVSVSWVSPEESAGQQAEVPDAFTATFSLRGSRLSVQAVEESCKAHEPIPY